MNKFDKYKKLEKNLNNGIQKIYKFENGFGASVIKNIFSYGGNMGLWEIAVLDSNHELTYETDITDNVIGYLTPYEVELVLDAIKSLDENGKLPKGYVKKWCDKRYIDSVLDAIKSLNEN
jgi:hypothetical protein